MHRNRRGNNRRTCAHTYMYSYTHNEHSTCTCINSHVHEQVHRNEQSLQSVGQGVSTFVLEKKTLYKQCFWCFESA